MEAAQIDMMAGCVDDVAQCIQNIAHALDASKKVRLAGYNDSKSSIGTDL